MPPEQLRRHSKRGKVEEGKLDPLRAELHGNQTLPDEPVMRNEPNHKVPMLNQTYIDLHLYNAQRSLLLP